MIVLLMASMCREYGEDWTDPATCSGAVRVQVVAAIRDLAPLLADPEADVRRAMMRILAVCPPALVRGVVDLREFDDENDLVRADALLALARVEHEWPGLRQRLEVGLHDRSPAVRQAAAQTLLLLDELPYPLDTVTVLADSIGAIGDLDAEFGGGDLWDRLPVNTQSDEPLDPHGLGILEIFERDPNTALAAAARIVAARTGHAVQGAYLADHVYEHWRDKEGPVAAVLADFISAAPEITYPRAHLLRLARCAGRLEGPDPSLAEAVRPWADSDDLDVVGSAITALATLRDPGCLEILDRAQAERNLYSAELNTVSEIYGARAGMFVPRLCERLEASLVGDGPSSDKDPVAYIAAALPNIGSQALAAVPLLLDLIEAGRAVRPALEALAKFGTAAYTAAGGRDVSSVIAAAFAAASSDFERVSAAVALRDVAGDDKLAHCIAGEWAALRRWENHTVFQLGRLGPAAAACALRISDHLDSSGAWTAVRAAHAYWRITGETQRCAEVLAEHVSEAPVGQAAVEALLEMRIVPEQCTGALHYLAYAPQRLAHDGFQSAAAHADDVLRDNSRALLELRAHSDGRTG